MAIQVSCKSCQGLFNAPDDAAGKHVRCPQCGGIIEIVANGATVSALGYKHYYGTVDAAVTSDAAGPESDRFDEPPVEETGAAGIQRRPCPMCGEMIATDAVKCRFCNEIFDSALAGRLGGPRDVRDPAWGRVRSGLTTMYYSIAALFGALVLLLIVALIMGGLNQGAKPDFTDSPLFIVFAIIAGITAFGGAIGIFIGTIMCANVPDVSRARGWAMAAILCMCGNIIASVAFAGAGSRNNPVSSLLSFAGYMCFFMFVRQAAIYLGDHRLAKSAGWLLILSLFMIGGSMVIVFAAVIARSLAVVAVAGLIFALCALIGFLWYLRLIVSLRNLITRRMERSPVNVMQATMPRRVGEPEFNP